MIPPIDPADAPDPVPNDGVSRPVSILRTLALLPSGQYGPNLSLPELGAYLGKHLNVDEEKRRNQRHDLRDQLYRDGGCAYMRDQIDHVFIDQTTRDLRKRWIEITRFNNPTKRIVNETSTVYAEPAKRSVADEAEQVKYKTLTDAVALDEHMLKIGRLLNLHRCLLVGFRVRTLPNGVREPVVDHATPAHVRAVLHPDDSKLVIGWLIRKRSAYHRTESGGLTTMNIPAWTLWTDYERVFLRDDLTPIVGTYVVHGLGVNPWIPVTLGPPDSGFWPGEEGEDLVAAHTAIWMENILLLKESKSATKQTIIQGDGATLARGQAADSEVPAELADGQSIQTVDTSMNLGMFTDTSDHILTSTGNNYGLNVAVINHNGAVSAEARELLRVPLRELRLQQQIPLRRFEHSFVLVMVAILEHDLPSMAFDPTGWRMEFGEAQTPLSMIDRMNLFIAQRAEGVSDTVEFLQALFPGMTAEEAMDQIQKHVAVETWRNAIMRPMQSISGSMGAQTPSTASGATDVNPAPDTPAGGMTAKFGETAPLGANPKYLPDRANSGPVPQLRQRGSGATPPAK